MLQKLDELWLFYYLQTQSLQVMLTLKFPHSTTYSQKSFRRNTTSVYTCSTHHISLDDGSFQTLSIIIFKIIPPLMTWISINTHAHAHTQLINFLHIPYSHGGQYVNNAWYRTRAHPGNLETPKRGEIEWLKKIKMGKKERKKAFIQKINHWVKIQFCNDIIREESTEY